jgi:hypothetical protein
MTPQRLHVLRRATAEPVEPGSCPACEGRLDDTGCRIEDAAYVRPRAARRTGLQAIYTVVCRGIPDGEFAPCPCCEAHPDRPCDAKDGG